MSDPIGHECGIAVVRLLKPLDYYYEKYGTPLYGFNKLFLLMEKQHNRGQDGAGIAAMKLHMPPGAPYLFRERNVKTNSLDRIFRKVLKQYSNLVQKGKVHPEFISSVKQHFDYGAEIYLGHMRYGTSGGYSMSACHPYFRRNNWPTKNLLLVGNFNMTNTPQLNDSLIKMGQHPIFDTDSQTLLEKIGYHLDEEHQRLYKLYRDQGMPGTEIAARINETLNPADVINQSSEEWDGGYTIAGLIGNGDVFVLRDPNGIRPCHYIRNDEVIAFASERAPLMTVFDVEADAVQQVTPGHVAVVKKSGDFKESRFAAPVPTTSCTFERIYFSRGNDPDIYKERKDLGGAMTDQILAAIDYDLEHTVFGYIPNTAEVAYYGLMDALRRRRREEVKTALLEAVRDGKELTDELMDSLIMKNWPRGEKVAVKDIKLRTFISQEKWRKDLASHVYDVSYGICAPEDTLVCIDDSIVRGTTLKQSILKILSRLNPRKIVIASTAPQIRYPDCYGIDMSELGKFIAFEAAVTLLKESGRGELLIEVYRECLRQNEKPVAQIQNAVRRIYDVFTEEELSKKITELVSPSFGDWSGKVEIIFQKIENLYASVPGHVGAWYFTGEFPTPGGYQVLNRAYINYFENQEGRSY